MSKKLGVISGLGSKAGVRFAEQLVGEAQRQGAVKDSDFPEFVLYNIPIRGMDEHGITDLGLVKSQLLGAAEKLDKWPVDYLVIVCNTVHLFAQEVDDACNATLLNMLSIAAHAVEGCKAVGVLSSETTKHMRLYETALSKRNINAILTTKFEQDVIDRIIEKVITGENNPVDFVQLQTVVSLMKARGAEKVISGCTELAILLGEEDGSIPIVDSGLETARYALRLLA